MVSLAEKCKYFHGNWYLLTSWGLYPLSTCLQTGLFSCVLCPNIYWSTQVKIHIGTPPFHTEGQTTLIMPHSYNACFPAFWSSDCLLSLFLYTSCQLEVLQSNFVHLASSLTSYRNLSSILLILNWSKHAQGTCIIIKLSIQYYKLWIYAHTIKTGRRSD